MSQRIYGYKKDVGTDHKMFSFVRNHPQAIQLPPKTNLIEKFRDVLEDAQLPYDQKTLGSCTSQSLAFAFMYDELSQHNKALFMPARLFIYYNERNLEGTTDQDSGAQISDGVAVLKKYGVCEESLWPYDCSRFTVKPSDECYSQGLQSRLLSAQKLTNDLDQIKSALVAGHPIVFGFSVYESFESEQVASTGIMPIPRDTEKLMGGHAVVIVGYDDAKQGVLVRNSWGPEWGTCAVEGDAHKGYFWMPYTFLTGTNTNGQPYCTDFWTLGQIQDPATTAVDNYSGVSIDTVVIDTSVETEGGVVNPFA
jgi:C1A family cysteine protease